MIQSEESVDCTQRVEHDSAEDANVGDDEVIDAGIPANITQTITHFLQSRACSDTNGAKYFLFSYNKASTTDDTPVLARLRLFLPTLASLRTIRQYASEIHPELRDQIDQVFDMVLPWEMAIIGVPLVPDASITIFFSDAKKVARQVDNVACLLRGAGYSGKFYV